MERFLKFHFHSSNSVDAEVVNYKRWKRGTCIDGKQRTKLTDRKISRNFKTGSNNNNNKIEEFEDHLKTFEAQYEGNKEIKDNLTKTLLYTCASKKWRKFNPPAGTQKW